MTELCRFSRRDKLVGERLLILFKTFSVCPISFFLCRITIGTILSIVLICTIIHRFVIMRMGIKHGEGNNKIQNKNKNENNSNNNNGKIDLWPMKKLPNLDGDASQDLQAQNREQQSTKMQRIILSFSAIQNLQNLFQQSTASNKARYPALDTLRVLLTILVFPITSHGLTRRFYPWQYRLFDTMIKQEMLATNGHSLSLIPGLWFDGLMFCS